MILVSNLVSRLDYPLDLHDLKLWDQDAESISSAILHGFNYRARQLTDRELANNLTNRIADAINIANQSGQISNSKLKNFKILESPMLLSDLRTNLELLDLSDRRCAYFALLTNMEIEQAMDLTWKEVNLLRQNGLIDDVAMDVIDSVPRHIRFPYVFWKYQDNLPVKLYQIKTDMEIAFGCKFEKLQAKFNSMVLTDPILHSEDIKRQFRR